MQIKYFGKKSKWENISRDERFFCAHLFFEIKNNPAPFLKLLVKKNIIAPKDVNPDFWEIGFEVCFYRDYVFEIGEKNGNKFISKSKYSRKRTFDLCLFSNHSIIIIEAKSHSGFDSKQLISFKKDEEQIKSLLDDKSISVISIALFSELYKPKSKTLDGFNCKITWKEMYKIYNNELFQRANKTELKED